MAIGPCRECGGNASHLAKICPHCGAPRPYRRPRPAPPESSRERRPSRRSRVWWLLVALGLGIATVIEASRGSSEPQAAVEVARPDRGSPSAATVRCQTRVREQLVSPGTARFGRGLDTHAFRRDTSTARWIVDGYVDATNRLGGTIRADYRCELEYIGGGAWRTIDVEVSER